ncbi:MAG: CehA/McbA family metallohydrolase [Dehalococcoidia bacterium]|nr:CehA/McbA family metallohydrolase [Dehalococcoidia bacterium]
MRRKLSLEGVFRRGDADLPFRYLPVEVPSGTKRLEVSYHFARDEAKQPEWGADDVVDIGVFDARGIDFLAGGFRGWSGSARRSFFITPREATPGYIRGSISPGTWQLFLGCRLLYSEACPYWVHVNLDIEPEAEDAEPVREASSAMSAPPDGARAGPGRWYRGDFHSHTVHSDGYNSIDQYVVEAQRLGLDFLAITDHNTTSHFEEIAARPKDGFLLVPGEEVTTFWGHANVWGAGCWVDFRCTKDGEMQRVLDWVHERGALFSPNHPKRGWPWEFSDVRGFRVTEVWQGPWRFYNGESLDFWEQRLRAGERVAGVGGSDCHSIAPAQFVHPWTLGNPCTWCYVRGPLDEAGVLDAVRAGQVFISEDATGPFLELTASCEERSYMVGDAIEAAAGAPVRFRLRYRGPSEKKLRLLRNGEVWQEAVAERDDVELEFEMPLEEPGYVRAEAAGFRGRPERGEVVHAMTNPIYLSPEAS